MVDDNSKLTLKKDICPQCSKKLSVNGSLCNECGFKLPVITDESNQNVSEWRKVKKKLIQSEREIESPKIKNPELICPTCNAIIVSEILQQCPVCETEVPLIDSQKLRTKETKLIFMDKKIVSEKSLHKDKNKWNIRESFTVFFNSIVIFMVFESLLLLYYTFFSDSTSGTDQIPINYLTVLISPFISMMLGLFPLIYIAISKHKFRKLGFYRDKILFFAILGFILGIFLFFTDIATDFILFPLIERYSFEPSNIAQEQEFILGMEMVFKVIFSISVLIEQVLAEFLFRGVIQTSFSKYYEDKNKTKRKIINKSKSILSTLGIELTFYLIFTLNPYFMLIHLIPSIFICIFYEYSENNMIGLIFLKSSYTTIGLIWFFVLI